MRVRVDRPALRADPQVLPRHIPGPKHAFQVVWRVCDNAHVHRGRVAKHRRDRLLQVPQLADIPRKADTHENFGKQRAELHPWTARLVRKVRGADFMS